MPQAIQFFRSVPRWLLMRVCSSRWPSLASGAFSCIRLGDLPPPELPAADWVRIKTRMSGVCGSDLSAIACKGSPYFSPFVSTPFVLGHEIVGDIVESGKNVPSQWKSGSRVIVEPALCCEVRGIRPPCQPCARGHFAHCENILRGTIKGGIQTGYCSSTGGGWSDATVVVHHSQLHEVPTGMSDELAVLAEPFACAIHAALKAPFEPDATVLVLGCGTIGLLAISGYRAVGGKARILAAARYPHQAEMARKLGADEVFGGRGSEALYTWVLERIAKEPPVLHRPEIGKPVLLGGVDAVIDCVGSNESIDDSLRLTRPRGSLILAGMPGIPKGIDWTSIWYKELKVQGAYAYGWEELPRSARVSPATAGGTPAVRGTKTMQLALQYLLAHGDSLAGLVNKKYVLQDYRRALDDAFRAGKSGAFKTVFDLRS